MIDNDRCDDYTFGFRRTCETPQYRSIARINSISGLGQCNWFNIDNSHVFNNRSLLEVGSCTYVYIYLHLVIQL